MAGQMGAGVLGLCGTNLPIHEPAWHQYGVVHNVDSLYKLFHHIDNAVFGELLLIVTGDAAQAVSEKQNNRKMSLGQSTINQ